MLFIDLLLIILLCEATVIAQNSFGNGNDIRSALKHFCQDKLSVNFCSIRQLKLSYEVIRQREELIEKERVQNERNDQIKNLLMKSQHSKFLKDLLAERYF